ncbi:hypothetical protein FKW77_010401 [Venturia effusa]|uniref:Uncharacterized protein n=1 Tax=Venturia effusa TaxID=50376 RepID=A0A517L4G0_9PEZI|nr:hypothetical protein FKW77_010401 [Venturia effusa]
MSCEKSSKPPPPPLPIIATSLAPKSGIISAAPSAMPSTQLTMSLSSRHRDALKRLLHNQGIEDQPHHDLDSLLHILLVRMHQEGWSIDTRGRLRTPEQTEFAEQAEARRRTEHTGGVANGWSMREEASANPPGVDGGRYFRESQTEISRYSHSDNLPRPGLLATPLSPPFAGNDCVRDATPRAYVPYMERGNVYRSRNQDHLKGCKDNQDKEEIDNDPHYIEEDAIFEFWLANIWQPVDHNRILEERNEVVNRNKGWFKGLWSGKES